MPANRTRTNTTNLKRSATVDAARFRDAREAIIREDAKAVFVKPKANADFLRRLKGQDLERLVDRAPTLSSHATNLRDGRNDKMVLLLARDKDGRPVKGLLVRLLQQNELRDQARTDKRGVAVLLFPGHHAHGHDAHDAAQGKLEAIVPGRDPLVRDVQVLPGKQHRIIEMVLDPPLVTAVPISTTDAPTDTVRATLDRVVDLMDNPLDRLPADFSTELCDDLNRFLGPTEDPILGSVAAMGGEDDFRQRRVPLVKRLTIARLGEPRKDKSPPRRYLVRLRQEWTFLGYTLGEVAEVDALDPGAIVKETVGTVERAVQSATRAVDTLVQNATETVESSLNQRARIESVVNVATTVKARAAAGGFGFALPFIAGGAVGAAAKVSTTTAVRTRTHASLDVNASLHVAKSLVNEAVSTVQSTQRDVRKSVTKALNQVSPLLSRVTNLMRWTLYENYMVCTQIEDVLEVEPVQIADLVEPGQGGLLFTDAQIVDLRRIFEPNLLEPSLRRRFDVLAAAVDAKRGAELPITAVHVTIDYNTRHGATLTAAIGPNEDQTTMSLRPGAGRVSQTIRLNNPLDDSAISTMRLDLANAASIDPRTASMLQALGIQAAANATQVTRVELAFQTASGYVRRLSIPLGSSLMAEGSDTASASESFTVPPPAIFTSSDPLVVHVNANKTYYFGLLCQAALVEPALRDDLPHFDAYNSNHEIWSLPIVGFEGNRALVVKDADRNLPEVKELLDDPGAATLIQLAAPGAYAEALQGLLKLAVDTEKIHPALLPAPAPVMPPIAVMDLTGKAVPLPIGGAPTPTPTPTPLPVPSP